MYGKIAVRAVLVLAAITLGATPAAAQPATGAEAPPFALTALDGSTVTLADLRGRIVVLHFGAGW